MCEDKIHTNINNEIVSVQKTILSSATPQTTSKDGVNDGGMAGAGCLGMWAGRCVRGRVLGVADGWAVILSCLSGSIIHELMDERVNEP